MSSFSVTDSRPHYLVLDGLRGVAALMVVWYHIFESYATSQVDQKFNHGYLAVDFFFLLSGFVMSYAYDHRWSNGSLGLWSFIKRRLIRLHPMVVMGAAIGAAMYYTQGADFWQVGSTSVLALLGAFALNALMIPSSRSIEIRGFGEMYPLNGPTWSLFFEYLGNLLYALVLRHLPRWALTLVVLTTGVGLAYFSITQSFGGIGVGWTMDGQNLLGGSLRFVFSFSAGLLLSRLFRPSLEVKDSFWLCSTALIALLVLPRIGGADGLWVNGIYDALCALILFPCILYLGASEQRLGANTERICRFLGDLSFPLYMVHFPLVDTYYAWVKNHQLPFSESWPAALAVFFGSIAIALLCLHFYDLPLRRYLSHRTSDKPNAVSHSGDLP